MGRVVSRMSAPRVINGVRILTSDEIKNLSPHGFRAYRAKVLLAQWDKHGKFKPFMGDEPVPTEKDVHDIRSLDWLAHEVTRECIRRKEADWDRRSKLRLRDPDQNRTSLSRFAKVT